MNQFLADKTVDLTTNGIKLEGRKKSYDACTTGGYGKKSAGIKSGTVERIQIAPNPAIRHGANIVALGHVEIDILWLGHGRYPLGPDPNLSLAISYAVSESPDRPTDQCDATTQDALFLSFGGLCTCLSPLTPQSSVVQLK